MIVKAVIFDLDGTIATFNIDYKTIRAEARAYLMKMGIPASLISGKEPVFDMLKKTQLIMENSGKKEAISKIRREVLRIAEKYELEAASNTSILPGAIETLKSLRKIGLKMAICTLNSENSTKHILERFKLVQFFDAVISRNQVINVKPDPEHCGLALKTIKVAGAETVFVGDSLTDMQAATEINAIAVGLPTGATKKEQLIHGGANYIITSITDLPILINFLNKPQN